VDESFLAGHFSSSKGSSPINQAVPLAYLLDVFKPATLGKSNLLRLKQEIAVK
jgi:hypothetical protein